MKIEFVPNVGERLEVITNALEDLFEQLVGQKSLSLITKYLITEDSNYKSVVNSIDENAEVSDNESAVGIAITIFNFNEKKSTIIIKNHQIIPLIHGLNSQLPLSDWTDDQLNALYTSLHEIGHGIDNFLRPQVGLEKLNKPFQFEKVCDYYHSIILGEVGANLCATESIPFKFKLSGRNMLINHVSTAYSELNEFCTNNKGQILNELDCFKIIGLISIVLLKIQEVYIHRANNNEEVCGFFPEYIQLQIKDWVNELENNYPNCEFSVNSFREIVNNILKEFELKRIEINYQERITN